MSVTNNSATSDVIDHVPNTGKGHEMENCNGSGKKGKQKKTGKSIFYPSNVHSNASSSNSSVSNGYKSQKSDQVEPQDSKSTSAAVHGNVSNGK